LTIRLGRLFGGDGAALASPVPIATVDGIDVFEPGAFDANGRDPINEAGPVGA
jgi:hypothetical protein